MECEASQSVGHILDEDVIASVAVPDKALSIMVSLPSFLFRQRESLARVPSTDARRPYHPFPSSARVVSRTATPFRPGTTRIPSSFWEKRGRATWTRASLSRKGFAAT